MIHDAINEIRPVRILSRGRVLILLVVLIAVSTSGCVVSRNPITGNKRAYGYSWQDEIAMGRNADAQIVQQYGLYEDADLAGYVNDLGQSLVEVSHLRREDAAPEWKATEFYFKVLDSPVVNAFALPGGYVYVTRGLLAHLEDEAQLAVVIGHEIGHIAGRHASKRAFKQSFGQALLLGGAVGGQVLMGGNAARDILNYGSAATQLLFLSYGRDDERESDDLGVEYASLFGYDASHAAAFFNTLKRLGEQSGKSIPSMLSTHPDPGEREQTIKRLAAGWAAKVPTDKVEANAFLSKINGIIYGDDPQNGFFRNGMFYHPKLKFEFPVPPGFRLVNQPSQVVLINEDQTAGVILEIENDHASARLAAEAFSKQEGVTTVQSGIGSAHGLSARYVVADVTNSNSQVTRLRAHFIDYQGSVFRFIGLAPKESFGTYDGYFQSTMKGFAPLTDESILATQPDRINVQRVSRASLFRSLLPPTMPPGVTGTMLAILNQVRLDETLQQGSAYKLIR
jgi:predicted Zn-dependent protease